MHKLAKRQTFGVIAAVLVFAYFFVIQSQISLFASFSSFSSAEESSSPVQRTTVAIIGARGYIGSFLHEEFQRQGLEVVAYDHSPSTLVRENEDLPVQNFSSRDIPTTKLRSHRAVIFLGGLTGRPACDAVPYETVYQRNVADVIEIAQRMKPSQHLLMASTSAISEGHNNQPAAEDSPVFLKLLDSYSRSMYERENAMRSYVTKNRDKAPQVSAFRFGTVIGVSRSQRTKFIHLGMLKTAFLEGKIRVRHGETARAVLWLNDLARAIKTVVLQSHRAAAKFEVYNLQSFRTTMNSAANQISSRLGVPVVGYDHKGKPDIFGFHLNVSKFLRTFPSFRFEGTQSVVVENIVTNAHKVVVGREITHRNVWKKEAEQKKKQSHSHHHHHALNNSLCTEATRCSVCGSHDLMTVLDLGEQPLANSFVPTTEQSLRTERYPLKLMRCRKCHHTQLSHFVDRGHLFSNYLYRSGTSRTLREYFTWLAKKITADVKAASPSSPLVVLELACNDGSQLDEFAKLGWKTYGVDPAANLASLRSKVHTVFTGLWGVGTYPGIPAPHTLSAIVAQNVVAHTTDPVAFLAAAAQTMGPQTRFYLQTSQCRMHDTGQFDTIYHEHISFFTLHSFKAIAERVGLRIVDFEITPIHGESCLLTLMRQQEGDTQRHAPVFMSSLADEKRRGLTEDWFYLRYRNRAMHVRDWVHSRLKGFNALGTTRLVAYGAAAKGMVMLHYLLSSLSSSSSSSSSSYQLEAVVDDEPLKQNMYCAGTRIPVKPTTATLKMQTTSKKATSLTIIVFAWNFFAEIKSRIKVHCPEYNNEIYGIVPFPEPRAENLCIQGLLTDTSTFKPLSWPLAPSSHYVLHGSIDMEATSLAEALLWMQHHARHFTDADVLLFNLQQSNAAEVLATMELHAPTGWEIRISKSGGYGKTSSSSSTMMLDVDKKMIHVHGNQYLIVPEGEPFQHVPWVVYRSHTQIQVVEMAGRKSSSLSRFVPYVLQFPTYKPAQHSTSSTTTTSKTLSDDDLPKVIVMQYSRKEEGTGGTTCDTRVRYLRPAVGNLTHSTPMSNFYKNIGFLFDDTFFQLKKVDGDHDLCL